VFGLHGRSSEGVKSRWGSHGGERLVTEPEQAELELELELEEEGKKRRILHFHELLVAAV
jgi:hypothetical protein